jgi:hypothetical protein
MSIGDVDAAEAARRRSPPWTWQTSCRESWTLLARSGPVVPALLASGRSRVTLTGDRAGPRRSGLRPPTRGVNHPPLPPWKVSDGYVRNSQVFPTRGRGFSRRGVGGFPAAGSGVLPPRGRGWPGGAQEDLAGRPVPAGWRRRGVLLLPRSSCAPPDVIGALPISRKDYRPLWRYRLRQRQ